MSEKKERFLHRINRQVSKLISGNEYHIRREVMKAFNPLLGWVGEGLQASLDELHSSDTHSLLGELAEMIEELDRNNDGKVDFKELRKGAGSFKKETLKFFFEVFDADGSGTIEKHEALGLLWTLKHTPKCQHCCLPIFASEQHGYCCMACIEAAPARNTLHLYDDGDEDGDSNTRTRQICSHCYHKLHKGCPEHGRDRIMPSHSHMVVGVIPAPAVLMVPGVEDNLHRCICCGEKHSLVVSYLRPHLKDLHMRPVMSKDRKGPQGFVCEYCAVRECSVHKEDNTSWLLDDPHPGQCRKTGLKCSEVPSKACNGHGEMVNVEKAFISRIEAHCPTCAKKMADGKLLTRPRRMPGDPYSQASRSDMLYACGSLEDQVRVKLRPWESRRGSAGGSSSDRDDVHSRHSDGSAFVPGGQSGWVRSSGDSGSHHHHHQQQQPWQQQLEEEPVLRRTVCNNAQTDRLNVMAGCGNERYTPDTRYNPGRTDQYSSEQEQQENPVLRWVNGQQAGQYRPGPGLAPQISVADSDITTGVLAPICSWESEMPSNAQPTPAAVAVGISRTDSKPLRDKYGMPAGRAGGAGGGAGVSDAPAGGGRRLMGPSPLTAAPAAGGGKSPLAALQEASEQYRRGTGSGWTSSDDEGDQQPPQRGGSKTAAARGKSTAGDEVEAAFQRLQQVSGRAAVISEGSPRSTGSGVAAGSMGRRPVSPAPGERRLSGGSGDGQDFAGVRYASLARRA